MKKKLISVLLCVMLVGVMLTGCGNGSEESGKEVSKESGDEDGYRVAYIARTLNDSFAAWLGNEMELASENYDDITLDVVDGQADDEDRKSVV